MSKKEKIFKYFLIIYIVAFWTEDSYEYVSLVASGLLFILTLNYFINFRRRKENISYALVSLLFCVFSIDGIANWYLKALNYSEKLIYKNFLTVTILIIVFGLLIFYGYKDINTTKKRLINKLLLIIVTICAVLFFIFYVVIPRIAGH